MSNNAERETVLERNADEHGIDWTDKRVIDMLVWFGTYNDPEHNFTDRLSGIRGHGLFLNSDGEAYQFCRPANSPVIKHDQSSQPVADNILVNTWCMFKGKKCKSVTPLNAQEVDWSFIDEYEILDPRFAGAGRKQQTSIGVSPVKDEVATLKERVASLEQQLANKTIPKSAKSGCLGEFQFPVMVACPNCSTTGHSDACEYCDGKSDESGVYLHQAEVPWNTQKKIWTQINQFGGK